MLNARNTIVNKLQTKTGNDTFAGLAIGAAAQRMNAGGGNGGDFILDASLNAAVTSGVDSAETIFGVATAVGCQ